MKIDIFQSSVPILETPQMNFTVNNLKVQWHGKIVLAPTKILTYIFTPIFGPECSSYRCMYDGVNTGVKSSGLESCLCQELHSPE